MKALGSVLGLIVGGFLVLLVLGLVNGGYLYRVECPSVGGTETEWTFRWQSVVPYIGYDRSGCEVHTGTAIALDAIGIRDLEGASAAAENDHGHSGEYSVIQRNAAVEQCVSNGEARAFCECAVPELFRRFSPSELQTISAVTNFSVLEDDLGERAADAASDIEEDCR
jgi:hypothetical protein